MVQSNRVLLANQPLRLALGAQVIARCVDRGLERGHLQQSSHAGGSRGLQHAAREFDMGATKAPAAETALIEDTDEIDDDVLAAKALAELRLLVDVAVLERQAGQHQQVLVLLAVARQHRDLVAVLDQAGDQARA